MLHLRKIIADSRGATAIEYALIASLISVAAIAAFTVSAARWRAHTRISRKTSTTISRQPGLSLSRLVRLACSATWR
jgi:Flp pilus assembly pilin Flp